MDPISAAASVASLATMGVQISQTIYGLISTFYEAEKEMSHIASDLEPLAMTLNELAMVLRRDHQVYRKSMLGVVDKLQKNCQGLFQGISNYIPSNSQDMRSSKQFQKRIKWYFQRHRVRPLQARLESMKSTLQVVLHVVQLARVTEGSVYYMYVLCSTKWCVVLVSNTA